MAREAERQHRTQHQGAAGNERRPTLGTGKEQHQRSRCESAGRTNRARDRHSAGGRRWSNFAGRTACRAARRRRAGHLDDALRLRPSRSGSERRSRGRSEGFA